MEAHLDAERAPSLTVRSVYGRNFPWLFAYDPEWASCLIESLFPKANLHLRYAAWESYLSNQVYKPLYQALSSQYDLALSELKELEKKDRKHWIAPVARMAEHMMTAYVYQSEEQENPLWAKFLRTASAKQRGMAVRFGGEIYLRRNGDGSMATFPKTVFNSFGKKG